MEEIQQLRRRVNERVLERAEADPAWKRQFLEDPETATGGIPEARQLRERIESAMPTEQPPPEATMPTTTTTTTTREEYRQLHRSLTEKILDRAASDPLWKQQLLDEPEVAMREANFPETQKLEEMRQSTRGSQEVRGQGGYVGPDRVDITEMAPVDPYPWYPTHAVWNCCQFYTQ
jgi:hypothetical protein